ncbi:hypothetical protein evm_007583 [Chilo suppressalis]|nr:hypothetical protein evm_007583 [Chilo suppressalis]
MINLVDSRDCNELLTSKDEEAVTTSKSLKRDKRCSVSEDEHLAAKTRLSLKRKKTKTRPSTKLLSIPPKPSHLTFEQTEKYIDTDRLVFENNCTVIENSFICPFHTSYSTYYCVYCESTFLDPSKLREHTLKHDPTKFKTFIFKKSVYLDIHRIDCRLCDKSIDNMETLKTHLSSEHGKRLHDVRDLYLTFRLKNGTLSCTECGKSFLFFHALKRHMADHVGTYVCDVCGQHFFDRSSLDVHNKKHHSEVDKISCTECGKLFKMKHNMLTHISTVHKKEAAFQCSKCDIVLFSQSERSKHLTEVHGQSRQFNCKVCGKAYNCLKNLRNHDRTVHLKIFNHKCSICDRGFVLPSRLNEHILSTHRDERSFHCEMCGKSYPRLHYLKRHIQSHRSQ